MRAALTAALVLATICYPLVVYFGLTRFPPRAIAAVCAVLLGMRLALMWAKARPARRPVSNQRHSPGHTSGHTQKPTGLSPWWLLPVGVVFFALAAILDSAQLVLFYPVLVSAAMLTVFAASLIWPPSVIERLARLSEPDLPPQGVIYTRRVTQVWCGFFVVNGLIATWTALYASLETWTLYNGLLSYMLIGALIGGELLIRQRVRTGQAA